MTTGAGLDLTVVIPAFNEAARIAPTLAATHAWLCGAGGGDSAGRRGSFEILVVDDGSTDETREVVRALAARLPEVRLRESAPNRGKGHVVRLGMLDARGTLRLFMDADGSTPVSELPKLLARIVDGADVAIGSRRAPPPRMTLGEDPPPPRMTLGEDPPRAARARKPPWYRRAWSRVANRVVQAGLLPGIRDTQCGFKLFTAEAAEAVFARVRTPGWGFDMEALALAHRAGYRIDEVGVAWSDDRRTKVRLGDALRITREFVRIRRMLARQT